jgi:alcohol dehydrogenase/propanol-preferring alcohol dehydrogenase
LTPPLDLTALPCSHARNANQEGNPIMRAWAVIEAGKPLQEIEIPTPEPTGQQVLLEITHAGVCHSDLHIWEGGYDLGSRGYLKLSDRGVKLPLAMGHEIVGRVLKWGPDANGAGLKVGDNMVVFPWVGCGTCDACRKLTNVYRGEGMFMELFKDALAAPEEAKP